MKRSPLVYLLYSLFAGPVLFILVYSLSSQWLFPRIWPEFTIDHWQGMLLGKSGILKSLGLSLALSAFMGILSTGLGFITSRYLFYGTKGGLWLRLAYLPFALSPIIYAISIHFYFNTIGLSASVPGVMLAQLFILYPYSIILFSTFWNARVLGFEQMVATHGGSRIAQWKHGIWPLARQVVILSLIQCFLISWFDFGMTQYIGVGKVKTLTIQVYQMVNEANPYMAAVASSLLLIPMLILLYVNRLFVLNKAYSVGQSS